MGGDEACSISTTGVLSRPQQPTTFLRSMMSNTIAMAAKDTTTIPAMAPPDRW